MSYVDGFVAAVPTANREAYASTPRRPRRSSRSTARSAWSSAGATTCREGKLTSFPMAVKRKDDETVVFSWITWPSRKARDDGMKKVMADPRMQPDRTRCRSTASG